VNRQILADLDLVALEARMRSWGAPHEQARRYARQVWQWHYRDLGTSVETLTEIPTDIREQLEIELAIGVPAQTAAQESTCCEWGMGRRSSQ
jgi:adenine C2-methylase RlmN of 23S rRNA A2503 and tRNA A37